MAQIINNSTLAANSEYYKVLQEFPKDVRAFNNVGNRKVSPEKNCK